jgi:transcriptional regulator with XRE-family HTH domain
MKQYNHEVITLTTFKRNFSFNKNIKEIVSKNIKKYRLDAGITQEQLAVDIGKSYDFVRRLEFKKGEIGCSLDTLYRISVVLNQPMGKFFEEK